MNATAPSQNTVRLSKQANLVKVLMEGFVENNRVEQAVTLFQSARIGVKGEISHAFRVPIPREINDFYLGLANQIVDQIRAAV